ncbi:nuclear transport factor 2 family protein [Amycolatopsis pithecellobii]|uniref:Nuclear transport factor 2 family protein n=1 Tax=Amycolatopsis pithecellobii TaxID=664692 RepID=A0A6N7Z416_9PSEU|nr:nuclear transport factor 2 family protein [Amycolatopsis pithecellobii]MTD54954.1 nuclear transport factor 2 family protein [Amycolatopsis pithecellobii]
MGVKSAIEADHTDPTVVLNKFYDAEMRYIAAGGAREGADFGEMASCLHPEVVMHQGPSVPFPGDWTGINEVERFFAVLSETWIAMDITNVKYFLGDDGVAVSMRGILTSRATGLTLDTKVGQFLIFSDGLIRDWTVFYQDPVRVGQVCGI